MSLLRVSLLLAVLAMAFASVHAASDASAAESTDAAGRREETPEALAYPTCSAGSYSAHPSTSYVCPAGQFKTLVVSGTGTCCSCFPGQFSLAGERCQTCGTINVNTVAPPSVNSYCYCANGWGKWVFNEVTGSGCTQQCAIGTANSVTMSPLFPGNNLNDGRNGECKACTAGTTTTAAGATTCINNIQCAAGSYANSAGTCSVCTGASVVSGQNNGLNVCQCASGYSNFQASSGTCSPCGLGTAGTGGSCSACAPGTFAATTGQTSCTPCSAGTASSDTGRQTACPACNAGSIAATQGLQTCSSCTPGSFAASSGLTTCTPCTAGTASSDTGRASACPACNAGSVAATQGLQTCSPCNPGSFAASSGLTTCTPCTAGTASADTGRPSACPACNAGSIAATQGLQTCTPCSAGSASKGSATSCSACGNGEWSQANQGTCTPCAAGSAFTGSSRTSACPACGTGTEQPSTGQATCSACAAGKIAPNTGTQSCSACGAGTYSTSATQCSNCGPGAWSGATTGNSQCTLCAAGKASTTITGATAESVCLPCGANKFSNEGASTCVDCGPNRYFALVGSACTFCPAGTSSASPVQATAITLTGSCADCTAPKYGTVAGAGCENCPQGRYWVNKGQCDLCPAGTYGATAGLANIGQCTAVTSGWRSTAARTSQVKCLAGTYASGDSCLPCTGNSISADAATSCTQCAPNLVANQLKTECEGCKAGTRLNTATSLCELCLQGTFSTADGSTQCEVCAKIDDGAAWSLNNARATNAFVPANALVGGTKCFCAPGYTRKSSDWQGSTQPDWSGEHCTVHNCAAGQYLSNGEGPSKCTLCPVDTFCSSPVGCGIGIQSCTPCSTNAWTNGKLGQASCVCKGIGTKLSEFVPIQGLPQDAVNQYVADQIGDAAPSPLVSLTDEQALAAGANCNPVCGGGQYYRLSDRKCAVCPVNTYCPVSMTFGCIEGGCLPCVGAPTQSGSVAGSTQCTCKSGFSDLDGLQDGSGCVSVTLARH